MDWIWSHCHPVCFLKQTHKSTWTLQSLLIKTTLIYWFSTVRDNYPKMTEKSGKRVKRFSKAEKRIHCFFYVMTVAQNWRMTEWIKSESRRVMTHLSLKSAQIDLFRTHSSKTAARGSFFLHFHFILDHIFAWHYRSTSNAWVCTLYKLVSKLQGS